MCKKKKEKKNVLSVQYHQPRLSAIPQSLLVSEFRVWSIDSRAVFIARKGERSSSPQ